jgi:hypothetical protein
MGVSWTWLASVALLASPARAAAADRTDPDAVFRAFAAYVEWERSNRIAGALGGAILGAGTIGLGAYLADRTDMSWTPWLVVGGIGTGMGVLALILPGPAERLAEEVATATPAHTAEQARSLELEWQKLADQAATERRAVAAGAFVLGAAALASGVVIGSGVGDLEGDRRTVVTGLLLGSGAALAVAGMANLIRHSPIERAFAQYQAAESAQARLEVTAAIGPDGWMLGVRGML